MALPVNAETERSRKFCKPENIQKQSLVLADINVLKRMLFNNGCSPKSDNIRLICVNGHQKIKQRRRIGNAMEQKKT